MATACAHFNMPAVCTDKAWHYVGLSFSPSANSQSAPPAQMQETYLSFGEFGGNTPGWLANGSKSKVHEEG